MRQIFLVLFLCGSQFMLLAQEEILTGREQVSSMEKKEQILKSLFWELQEEEDDFAKAEINQEIFENLRETLTDELSFEYPFDSLRNLGKVYSDDYTLRVYTWNVQRADSSFLFYGFIQRLTGEKMLIPLIQAEKAVINHNQELNVKQWYGALYYKIVQIGTKKSPRYLLLGWRKDDIFAVNQKMADVLRFDKEDVIFGDNIFSTPKGMQWRIMFNYCADVQMSLLYDKTKKRIVFDHLIAIERENGNCFATDDAYDSFVKKGNKWLYKSNVDAKNE